MQVVNAVAAAMRQLARWRVLGIAGVLYAVSTVVFFTSSLPFSIPSVTAACGQPPPDVRFFTPGDQVQDFLAGCGEGGRAAYRSLQIADLFYPAICGLFLAAALAMALNRVAGPRTTMSALAVIPLLGMVFDYAENAAAWITLVADPGSAGVAAHVLGVASVGKQLSTWLAWSLLVVVLAAGAVRWSRHRHSRPSLTASGAVR